MTTTIQIRIDNKTKLAAQKTLAELGLDMSSAVKMFFAQINQTKSLPFSPITREGLKLRNWDAYQQEMKMMDENPEKYKKYKNAKEALADVLK